jgi:hypothetical protein
MALNLPPAGRDQCEGEAYQGRVMTADRAGLGFLGFVFGGVTAAVMLVACTVVAGHVQGGWAIDAAPVTIVAQQ